MTVRPLPVGDMSGRKPEAQKFREDRQRCYRVLSDYYYLLKKLGGRQFSPDTGGRTAPRFVEAIHKKTYVEYLLDLFLYESEEEQRHGLQNTQQKSHTWKGD
mgnify:CR=1 FL=1